MELRTLVFRLWPRDPLAVQSLSFVSLSVVGPLSVLLLVVSGPGKERARVGWSGWSDIEVKFNRTGMQLCLRVYCPSTVPMHSRHNSSLQPLETFSSQSKVQVVLEVKEALTHTRQYRNPLRYDVVLLPLPHARCLLLSVLSFGFTAVTFYFTQDCSNQIESISWNIVQIYYS